MDDLVYLLHTFFEMDVKISMFNSLLRLVIERHEPCILKI